MCPVVIQCKTSGKELQKVNRVLSDEYVKTFRLDSRKQNRMNSAKLFRQFFDVAPENPVLLYPQ